MKNFFVYLTFCFAIHFQAHSEEVVSKSHLEDQAKIFEQQKRCEVINLLLVNKQFKTECFEKYNHYGPSTTTIKSQSKIKIANYNLLHPGTSKTLFKDYAIVAKIMNQYDIVSGLELLGTVGRDEIHNKKLISFLESAPALLEKLKNERLILNDSKKIKELDAKILKLSTDTNIAYDLFRAPGYLKVLTELKKLDPSWSLVITPRGDSAMIGSVEELSGFYYRASVATPTTNPHCQEYAYEEEGISFACFITLDKRFMGRELVEHFSRRPFMASFKVGQSTIHLVTSHIVFTYSGSEEEAKDLLQKTFGVEDYKELGSGINAINFARYAEVKNTLEFMNKFRARYNEKKIMLLADMNLVSKSSFWPKILSAFPGGELLITEPTTISPTQFLANGNETHGVANDYDHFILDPSDFSNCNKGEVLNYFQSSLINEINAKYGIRQEDVGFNKNFHLDLSTFDNDTEEQIVLEGDLSPVDDQTTFKLDYPLSANGQSKMDKSVARFEKYLLGLKTIKGVEVVQDDFQTKERLDSLRRRVFLRQLTKAFYYRHVQEVVSDHFPIALTCHF